MELSEDHGYTAYVGATIIALVVLYLVSLFARPDSKSKVKRAPGSVLTMVKAMSSRDAPFKMLQLHKEVGYDPLFRLNLPVPGGAYVIVDAAMQKEVFADPGTDKPTLFYETFKKISGHASVLSRKTSDPRWKHLRRGSAPAFSSTEVGRMNRICSKHVNQWMETVLDPIIDNPDQSFDPGSEMTKLTFRVILEAGFEYSPTDEEFNGFISNLNVALIEISLKQPLNPFRATFGFMIPEVRQAMACCKELQKFGYKVLKEYRDNKNKSDSNTLIKLIENNPHDLTEEEKMTEVVMYLFAGHDTTGHLLGNILVLLAKHQDIQTKAIESLPKNATTPSEYLAHVIQESKRYRPSSAFGSLRIVSRTFDFGDGMILPKGAHVFLIQILTSHDPKVFDRRDEFLPGRWENATRQMIDSILPFAHGARSCIGQSLAQAEVNSVLPVLVSKYRFEIVDEGKLDFFTTLKFAGARLKVTRA